MTEAAAAIESALPLSEDAAIEARQAGPCQIIVGKEALGVQQIVGGLLPADANLGDKQAPQKQALYSIIEPRLDDQWSVATVQQVQRAGTVLPGIPGVQGRSILTFVIFSGGTVNRVGNATLEGPLLVRVEGVYDPTGLLTAAQVSYSAQGSGGQRVAPDPAERREIQQAIANQVYPDNLYSVT